MKTVKCGCGCDILVDDEDYKLISQIKWTCNPRAVYKSWSPYHQPVHSFVIPSKQGFLVDHIDRNIHNNQKSNLRYATPSQNTANQKVRKDSYTGYKGVSIRGNRCRATLFTKGKQIHLGYFDSLEEAARAYDKKAKEVFGEFATLNFPNEN